MKFPWKKLRDVFSVVVAILDAIIKRTDVFDNVEKAKKRKAIPKRKEV